MITMLSRIGRLSEVEIAAIQRLPARVRSIAGGLDIVRDGDVPTECCIILDGLACRYKVLRNGPRQIMSFHFAGDMPDLQSLHLGRMDHSIGAIRNTQAAFVPHAEITALIRQFPSLSDLFWKATLIEGAVLREWMTGLGRRSALARMAHLFCEVKARIEINGASPLDWVRFPVTQADLSDAMGLSPVHVNRVMKALKLTYGVQLRSGRLQCSDWPGLVASCDFEPSYLHLYETVGGSEVQPAARERNEARQDA